MITVKLFGGAKKSLSADKIEINNNSMTIEEICNYLIEKKPKDTPDLDFNNILVAKNGIDSSALEGKSTKLSSGDVVSIIPIIHGGSRTQLQISNHSIEIFEIKNQNLGVSYLDEIKKQFPDLVLQAISINFILGKSHLQKILSISLQAKKNKILLSKKLETDILMRFAVTTQISEAIRIAGIKNNKDFFLIAIGNKSKLSKLYSKIKKFTTPKTFSKNNNVFLKKHFKITQKQINSIQSKSPLEDLLAEKGAVLL